MSEMGQKPEQTATIHMTRKGLETRQKLLAAAEQVFGAHGYYEASIVTITQVAQVAQGTFYNYFPSKKAIYDELIRQLSRDLRSQIKGEVTKAHSHEETMRLGFQAFFRWVKDHRNLYGIVQQAVLVDEELYRWYYDKLASGYIKSLTVAMEERAFRSLDKETLAYCLMSIGQFLGMRWVYWENQEVPDEVFETAMSFILLGMEQKKDENKQ
ncbi:TetR/AcrR family transcriptional regulator [Brevibacillus laterosporus]|nr:TetR/AcrR family transcriptional regulator [Brevibacillus laterosporus]TPG68272.1 TetR/AcrR family transcriptional regulator [Brevibacillus laterosporus]